MVLAFTPSEKIQLAAVSVTTIATTIALLNFLVTSRNERRRTQPIVIAHEASDRTFAPRGISAMWVVEAYLTSEGAGPAFNVRFGVEFGGVRYPYRLSANDPNVGNIQRVLPAGGRRPDQGAWPILIDSLTMTGRAFNTIGDIDEGRKYWARFESAQGTTWETINPGDRSARLDIRRVRFVRLHEWTEGRHRKRASEHDAETVAKALEELRAGMYEDVAGPAQEDS